MTNPNRGANLLAVEKQEKIVLELEKDVDYPERPRGFVPRENDWFKVVPFRGYWIPIDENGKEGLPVIESLGRWLVGEDEFKNFRPAACWALRNA